MRLEITGEYPPDWHAIARRVKEEASFRCIRCNHPFEADSGPRHCDAACDEHRGFHRQRGFSKPGDKRLNGINYTVHHLDGDKSNSRWWNLLALCNSCHLSIQARVIPGRPWLFEHSLWFRDYVCGFYAFYYARQEVPRDVALARAGEWLALGQPWLGASLASPLRDGALE